MHVRTHALASFPGVSFPSSQRLLSVLSAKCAAGGGSAVVDMQDMFFRLTIDIFT